MIRLRGLPALIFRRDVPPKILGGVSVGSVAAETRTVAGEPLNRTASATSRWPAQVPVRAARFAGR
jgi:hypothetical protein